MDAPRILIVLFFAALAALAAWLLSSGSWPVTATAFLIVAVATPIFYLRQKAKTR